MLQNNYHWPAPVNTMQRQYTLAASHKSPRDFHIHGACSAVRPASMESMGGRAASTAGELWEPAGGSTVTDYYCCPGRGRARRVFQGS